MKKLIIKPCQLKELAALYEVSVITFRQWIRPFRDEIGKIRGRCLTIPQIKVIFAKLDFPPCYQHADDVL